MDTAIQMLGEGQYLTARAGGTRYGFPIHQVREIVACGQMTPLPGASLDVRGVLNLRGGVLTVTDLAVRMGQGAIVIGPRSAVIVTVAGAGILVEAVETVTDWDATTFSRPEELGARIDPAVLGVAQDSAGFVLVLDVERMLGLADQEDV